LTLECEFDRAVQVLGDQPIQNSTYSRPRKRKRSIGQPPHLNLKLKGKGRLTDAYISSSP
jgi:hypothetical protein